MAHTDTDSDRLIARALSAYFATADTLADPPAPENANVVDLDRHRYVRLLNRQGRPVAVYRLHNHGALRRMVRPPRGVLLAS